MTEPAPKAPSFDDLPPQVQQQMQLEAAIVGQRVQKLYPLAEKKEISSAVNRAVSEGLALGAIVEWMHGEGPHTDKVLLVDIGRENVLSQEPTYYFSILQRTPRNEVPVENGQHDLDSFMQGVTAEGLVFSTGTRALAYMRGWVFRFRLVSEDALERQKQAAEDQAT